jgi:hypothetical protein
MQITNDRRSRPRVPARGHAIIDTGRARVRCSCVDLSAGGLGVIGPFSAATGQRVRLEFSVDGHELTLPATIERARRRRDGYLWGLSFDPGRCTPLTDLVTGHHRWIAWMRQAKPYLDRLYPPKAAAEWSPSVLSVSIGEPRPRPIAGFSPVLAPTNDGPAPMTEVIMDDLVLDDAPTRVYDATVGEPLAPGDATTGLVAVEPTATPSSQAPTLTDEVAAFESDTLAELDARDAAPPRPPSTVAFEVPTAPPVRRQVPTLAAPTVTPSALRRLYADALAQVTKPKRRPRHRA